MSAPPPDSSIHATSMYIPYTVSPCFINPCFSFVSPTSWWWRSTNEHHNNFSFEVATMANASLIMDIVSSEVCSTGSGSSFSKDRIDLERVAIICRSWPTSWLPEGGMAAKMSCFIRSSLSPSATEKSIKTRTNVKSYFTISKTSSPITLSHFAPAETAGIQTLCN